MSQPAKILIVLWLLLCCTGYSFAQQADTLKAFEITAQKQSAENLQRYTPGQKKITIDSNDLKLFRSQSLASLLYQKVPVFIKSYGFNGIATLNFRGSSAAQSQVLWNGIPLQNAALGLADVSTLPVAAIDNISIVYGGAAALSGSGNIGGAILLDNGSPSFDTATHFHTSLSAGYGSYAQWQGGIKAGFSSRKWQATINLFGQHAANNFMYTDEDSVRTRQTHARLRSGTAIANLAWKPNIKDLLQLHGWLQQYDRQIPMALFESISKKQQTDQSRRVMLTWDHQEKTFSTYFKSAIISDRLNYQDSLITLYTHNQATQYYNEAGIRKTVWNKLQLLFFTPVHYSNMRDNAGTYHSQTKIALAITATTKTLHNNLDISASLRQEWINGLPIFLGGGNAKYGLTRWADVLLNVQKTYRAPSLNELYYYPGGNDALKPEHGWAEDLTIQTKLPIASGLLLLQDASVYNRNIHNWIIWYGGSIWTPHNIATVNSQGMEISQKLLWTINDISIHIGHNGSYTTAHTTQSYQQNDGSIGKQIPYTPHWLWQANAGIGFKNITLSYAHVYTGYRFVTTDESERLPAYQTGNINLLYTTTLSGKTCQFTFQLNNLFNNPYQVVSGRPMPGRNFLTGAMLTF